MHRPAAPIMNFNASAAPRKDERPKGIAGKRPKGMDASSVANACADLVDRNVADGRADKPAFIEAETIADLWRSCSSRPAASRACWRALGLRREDRIAHGDARYDRISDRLSRRDPRRHRAGSAQHAADERAICLHARRFPRQGACRLLARSGRFSSQRSPRRRISRTSSSPMAKRPAPAIALAAALAGESGRDDPGADASGRALLLALFLGLDRQAPRACVISIRA